MSDVSRTAGIAYARKLSSISYGWKHQLLNDQRMQVPSRGCIQRRLYERQTESGWSTLATLLQPKSGDHGSCQQMMEAILSVRVQKFFLLKFIDSQF